MRIIFLLLFITSICFSLSAQTDDWKSNYDFVGRYIGGFAQIQKGDKYGFADRLGNEVVAPKYDKVFTLNKFGTVILNGKWGMVNNKGEEVIPTIYDKVNKLSDGLSAVMKGKEFGYFNTDGELVIPFQFQFAKPFKNGIAIVQKDGKKGIIDKTGEVLIPFEYGSIEATEIRRIVRNSVAGDNLAPPVPPEPEGNLGRYCFHAKKDRSTTYYNSKFEQIAYHKYVGKYKQGIAYYRNNGIFGFVNVIGEVILPLQYEGTKGFSEGLAPVKKGEKWGYINLKGELVIPYKFDDAKLFNKNKAYVANGDEPYFHIDRQGNRVE